ncbi:hypothetical protein Ccrd_006336 [Cynara cardunculus var. scolymus]|uniref:Uncharacterized protein n=1 Tax=Cynara cardunculus var. scolymus TaxID=59895 RepID=A0A103XJ37_CYNCS|nr:hypothetical protein Ccrd_006336 [Cynara cardunculus var. scolymus]
MSTTTQLYQTLLDVTTLKLLEWVGKKEM